MVGAGGLGGYYGARLAAAGRNVTFLVRPRSAKLLTQGLRVVSPDGDVTIAEPRTVLAEDLAKGWGEAFDLVVLTCKAGDLDDAMKSMAPAVGASTSILPLLNGMAHMAALDERFGRGRVLGGACFISATRDADGTVKHLGQMDKIVFGDRDEPAGERIQAVAKVLVGAGFEAEWLAGIEHAMWEKWSFIATTAGITCLLRAAIGDIIAAGAEAMSMQLFAETTGIAAAYGYPAGEGLRARAKTMLSQKGSNFTASMLRDIEAGAPVEAQQIVGDLLRHGRAKGVPTPLLEVVFAHLRCYEERRLRELSVGDAS